MLNEWKNILEKIKEWVTDTGEEQVKLLNQPKKIIQKSAEIDLVTEVDLWSERFLMGKIQKHFPGHSILSEESGIHTGEEGYEWVIDPIDGTTNYAHGFPFFSISVAVKYHGEAVIGVVYAPKLNELYEAIKGEGAFLNGSPINVSKTKELNQAIIATGFPYDRATDPNNNVKQFSEVVTKVQGIRRTGSAALDLCQVAAGRFDGYWEFKLNQWDIEAGILIVNEAGGRTRTVNKKKGIYTLVGNEYIFEALDTAVVDDRD
jgi:myo-inositol-1(or 4)-monophosphatase